MSNSARPRRNEHPYYIENYGMMYKFRLTYEGGEQFKRMFLQKFSDKETDTDFARRMSLTYVPAFAKAAIQEIVNTLGDRMKDVTRVGGSKNYNESIEQNIDGRDRSMTQYCIQHIIPELLIMGKVGVYVDSTVLEHNLKSDEAKPYIYHYPWEDIKNWKYDAKGDFEAVLLRDREYKYDADGFPTDVIEFERYIYKKDGKVYVRLKNGIEPTEIELKLKTFPFIILELNQSLLTEIADYQIALMNLGSSDMSYCMYSNIPFYVEPYSPIAEAASNIITNQAKEDKGKVEIGVMRGRRYPDSGNAPEFISPSTEPLQASMQKQTQLKEEMRHLLALSISNLRSTWASADSKAADKETESNGLFVIGQELQRLENQVAQVWSEYEGDTNSAIVLYPKDYSSQSSQAAIAEANELFKLIHIIPSDTYKRGIGLRIIRKILTGHVSALDIEKAETEVLAAISMNSDPDTLTKDIKNGLVGNELASKLRGYPEGEVDKAEIDHAEKLYRISLYQSAGSLKDPTNPQGRIENGNAGESNSDSGPEPSTAVDS
jgi:hypothetical protein